MPMKTSPVASFARFSVCFKSWSSGFSNCLHTRPSQDNSNSTALGNKTSHTTFKTHTILPMILEGQLVAVKARFVLPIRRDMNLKNDSLKLVVSRLCSLGLSIRKSKISHVAESVLTDLVNTTKALATVDWFQNSARIQNRLPIELTPPSNLLLTNDCSQNAGTRLEPRLCFFLFGKSLPDTRQFQNLSDAVGYE